MKDRPEFQEEKFGAAEVIATAAAAGVAAEFVKPIAKAVGERVAEAIKPKEKGQ